MTTLETKLAFALELFVLSKLISFASILSLAFFLHSSSFFKVPVIKLLVAFPFLLLLLLCSTLDFVLFLHSQLIFIQARSCSPSKVCLGLLNKDIINVSNFEKGHPKEYNHLPIIKGLHAYILLLIQYSSEGVYVLICILCLIQLHGH